MTFFYHGTRHTDGTVTVTAGDKPLAPVPLPGHDAPSPVGFDWGSPGTSSARLAYAILLDATGDPLVARTHFARFKRQFTETWPAEWTISKAEVEDWLAHGMTKHG